MPSLLKKIVDQVREDFGQPVSLLRLISEHPEMLVTLDQRPANIDARNVVRWDKMGEASVDHQLKGKVGVLQGWRMNESYFGSFSLRRKEYAELGRCEVIEDWTCDISDVFGFSGSKSNLQMFTSTDEMAEAKSPELINEITLDALSRNLSHKEIRILHSPESDYFSRCLWDDRLFLVNSGGSHHFAAAKYIAARLGVPVELKGRLNCYALNGSAIDALCRDFAMFVISDDPFIATQFHESMSAFQATWLWHNLPDPFEKFRAILLPKNEKRSMRVATVLRDSGATDLGQHLTNMVSNQGCIPSQQSDEHCQASLEPRPF